MNYLKLSCFVLSLTICSSCNKTADLKKDEVFKIISEIFIDENVRIRNICGEFEDSDMSRYAKELEEEDIEFYRDQKAKISDFSIAKYKIQSFVKGYRQQAFLYRLGEKLQ